MPIGQRQAQPFHVRMSGPDLRFDGCDLAPATGDSRCLLATFLGDFGERTAVAIEHRINSEVVPVSLAD